MKYVVRVAAVIDAKDDAEAAAVSKKLDEALRKPTAKLYFEGQGIKFVGARVDPRPTKE